jgi:hypothetical protein
MILTEGDRQKAAFSKSRPAAEELACISDKLTGGQILRVDRGAP